MSSKKDAEAGKGAGEGTGLLDSGKHAPKRSSLLRPRPEADQDEWKGERLIPKTYYPTAANVGTSMLWGVEYGYKTAFFVSMLDLPLTDISYVWLASSTSVLLVLPFVGAASDFTAHPWGRRRIYIFYGLLMALIGYGTLPNARLIGDALGDVTSGGHDLGITIAIVSLVVAEVGNELIRTMERALLADVVTAADLPQGNAFFSFNEALGKFLAFGLGSLNLVSVLTFFGSDIRALFVIALLVLTVMTTVTMANCPEEPFVPQTSDVDKLSWLSAGHRVLYGARTLPKPVRRAFVSQFLTLAGWAQLFYYGADWYGTWCYGGSSTTSSDTYYLYEQGTQMANVGYLLMAAVAIASSFAVTELCERYGVRGVLSASLVWSGACMLSLYFIPEGSRYWPLLPLALLGVPLCSTYAIPWTIVTAAVRRKEDAALFCTLFRVSEVAPWVLMGLISGGFITMLDQSDRGGFVTASGIFVLAALYSHNYVIDPERDDDDDDDG